MKDDDGVISVPIDEVVQKTYETVQRARNRIRRQLLRNELKESRNDVLGGAILQSTDGQRKEETKQQTRDDDIRARNSTEDGGDDTTTTTDNKGVRHEGAPPAVGPIIASSGPLRSDRPRNGHRKRLIETFYIKDYSRGDSGVLFNGYKCDNNNISIIIANGDANGYACHGDSATLNSTTSPSSGEQRRRIDLLHSSSSAACDVDNDSATLNSTTSQKRRSGRHHASSAARDVNDCREITTTITTTAMDDRWIGKGCIAVTKKSISLSNGRNARRAAINTWRRISFDERRRSALVFPRLPTNDESISNNLDFRQSDDCDYKLSIKVTGCSTKSTTTVHHYRTLPIECAHPPCPKSVSTIFLKSSLAVDDEPILSHVPYFVDGDDNDNEDIIYSELFDMSELERVHEFGPKYKEEETLGIIDDVLKLMMNMKSAKDQWDRIHLVLSDLVNIDLERVKERHSLCIASLNGQQFDRAQASLSSSNIDARPKNGICSKRKRSFSGGDVKLNSDVKVAVPYQSIIDSYRNLFCRRCFTYDCNIHGNLPKASLDLLGELAVQKESDGQWDDVDKDIDTVVCGVCELESNNKLVQNDMGKPLTPSKQSICERACLIFRGDTDTIAKTIGASPNIVRSYIQSNNLDPMPKYPAQQLASSRKNGKRVSNYTSMKNYNPKWLRNIQSRVIHPEFLPCDHTEPCNDVTCSCIQNGFFCTKHCGHGQNSPNFFRGCACKAGECRTNACPCHAAKRECDPDLCRTCGACSDPPNAPTIHQRCRNDSISMRRHVHTLVGESDIPNAGFGLYTKHSLRKGDYVIEYVGEQISQEEAERRGVVYDKMNMSYLFNLSSDLVIDATRKGNKSRYMNHSSEPNMEPKMIFVNGDMRIGFFAKTDIDAQSELFFDYRYDDKLDNELIYKPDHSINFDWMKKKKKKNDNRKKTNIRKST